MDMCPGEPAAQKEAKDRGQRRLSPLACPALVSDKAGLGAQHPQLKAAQSSSTGGCKLQRAGPTPEEHLGWSPSICFSNKFPANAAGPGSYFEDHCSRGWDYLLLVRKDSEVLTPQNEHPRMTKPRKTQTQTTVCATPKPNTQAAQKWPRVRPLITTASSGWPRMFH